MKHKIILITIVLAILSTIGAQSQTGKQSSNEEIDIIRLNGITNSGDRVFGIHLNLEEAIRITVILMDEKNKYQDQLKEVELSLQTVDKKKGCLVFEQFKGASPNGYWKIPKKEFDVLTILQSKKKKQYWVKAPYKN